MLLTGAAAGCGAYFMSETGRWVLVLFFLGAIYAYTIEKTIR